MFLILLYFVPVIVLSQEIKFKFEHITSKDGLAANRVLCMATDSFGYRWYGTTLGTSRYDGVHYDNIVNIDNNFLVSSNSIQQIICYKNDIIFLNSDGIVYTYNYGKSISKLTMLKIVDFQNNLVKISNICKSKINNIVFGFDTSNNIYKINIHELTYELALSYTDSKINFQNTECSLNIDNSIFFGSEAGLFEYDYHKNVIEKIDFGKQINNNQINCAVGAISFFDEQSFVFGGTRSTTLTFNGIIKYNYKTKKLEKLDMIVFNNDSLSNLQCKVIHFIKNGKIIIVPTTKTPVICDFNAHTFDTIPVSKQVNSLSTISIGPCIFEESGKLTICTNQGIFLYEPFSSAFEEKFPYKDLKPAPSGQSSCYFDKKRNHLLMSSAKCLRIFDYKVDSTIKLFNYPFVKKHHLGKQKPILINIGYDSILIIGSFLYVFDLNTEQLTNVEINYLIENSPIKSSLFPYIIDPNNKNKILFFRDGILKHFDKKLQLISDFKITNELNQPIFLDATGLDKDKDNNLWATSYNYGLVKLIKTANESYQIETKKFISNNLKLNDLHIDNENTIWVATKFGGLFKYNIQTYNFNFFNTNNGFPVNNLYQISEDFTNKLWIQTSFGISSFDKRTNEILNYDGQNGIGFPHNLDRGKYKDEDDNIYISSGIGFVKINPKNFINSNPPIPVYIKRFFINNQEVGAFWKDTSITISASENDFTFEISAVNLTHGHLNKYKYTLENYHNDWINTTKNQLNISFNNLNAGKYIFKAIACNHLGNWNSKGIQITIIILPYWYKTWWFTLLILILITLLLSFLNQKFINKKLALQQAEFDKKTALLLEKDRIAKDIHDDIGTGISAIHLIANYIKNNSIKNNFEKEINHILQTSSDINQNLKEIVWSVNSASDTLINLNVFIKKYVYELNENIDNVNLSFETNGDLVDFEVGADIRKSIFLCVKEAINNALKHANATYIKVIFEFNLPNIISIKIIDNGVGFDPNINLLSNYGLKNMKNRIENIGGKFNVEVNDLTTIHLEITII